MNRVYQKILQNLINSNCSLPTQSNEFYEYLAHIAEALPDFLEKIDLDSNPPSYQEGDANPVPDWKESIFYHNESDERIGVKNIWNESLRDLWHAIDEYSKQPKDSLSGKDERTLDIYIEPKADKDEPINTILVDDIRYGDAGANFLHLLSQYQKRYGIWVKPEKNLIGQTYKSVRGVDVVLKQILNDTLLQFTNYFSIEYGDAAENRGIIHSQIRLLMPKNSRWVLVEDLNRNFWVLGNTIGGLCAYLFGAGSPIRDIFERLVNELVQLWENTIFLWLLAAFALIKPCTDIHVEMFFVPNDVNEPYKKYDNFDNFQSIPYAKARIIANTVAYAKKYQNSNCVMFPMIRKNNYEKNYFDWVFIPFVIFIIHEGDGSEKVVVQDLRDKYDYWVQAHPSDYAQKLWCARETPVKYYYYYPLNDVSVKYNEEVISHKYYAGFRPRISVGSKEIKHGEIHLTDVSIDFTDAIGESFGYDNLTAINYTFKNLSSSLGNNYKNQTDKVETISSRTSIDDIKAYPSDAQTIIIDKYNGYYLGDFPSTYEVSAQGKHFRVVSENSLATQAMLIKIGQYLPKIYKTSTNPRNQIETSTIYNNPNYFSEQVNSSNQVTSYELNYTPNEHALYSGNGMSLPSCSFYVCDSTQTCFKRTEDLNINVTDTDTAWTRLKTIGNEVISEFIHHKNINKITYLMAAIGVKPWYSTSAKQGYWTTTILTHMYRFIPHRLIDFWDKYGKSKTVDTYEFTINGEKCYLECLGFVGKIEKAYDDTTNFKKIGSTTWRLPELRSYYDQYYNDFLELQDIYDTESEYYLDMSKYSSSNPLKQEYNAAIQAHDWTSFEQFLSDHYEEYKDDFLPQIKVGESITTLAGLWCVYDGNTRPLATEAQPAPVNHLFHDSTFIEDGLEKKYRQVGNMYFIFNDKGEIILPTKTEPVTIDKKQYWANSRKQTEHEAPLVNGTYIMEIDNNIIKDKEISF